MKTLVLRRPAKRISGVSVVRSILYLIFWGLCCTGCQRIGRDACPVTEPIWAVHPDDVAVEDPPVPGNCFVNQDRSIWASVWWTEQEETDLKASDGGIKIGWFRPSGAELMITGQRIDADSLPLEAEVPCCYPTRFQASGLYFPRDGCWEITVRAAVSELAFVDWVEP